MPVIQPITSSSGSFPYVPNTRTLSINGVTYDLSADRSWTISTSGTGTVTSVALSATMPTGLVASISGSPITSNGTLGLTVTMQSGYAIPTTAKQTQWDSAYSFTSTFPSGTAQQLLRVNTLGTALEFFTPSYIVSTDIIASSPLVWNSGTKTMSIPVATNSVNGYLSSTDWLTFSSKQPAITLTTTGNNGSATLVGATLNIPTYTLVGLGGMSNPFSAALGQMIYSNSAGAPLSLAPNTTTTKKYLAMTGDGTNGAAPVWDTISGITGSGTTNYVAKFTSSSAVSNSLIYDDGTNLAIGSASPSGKLHVQVAATGTSLYLTDATNSTFYITHPSLGRVSFYNGTNTRWLTESGGNLGLEGSVIVGGVTPNAKFQVNGGGLAISGSGFMVSAGLTNGRLETYQSGTANCIHSYLDRETYEISCGSTSGYVSGLVITGRDASTLPDRVALYTRNTMRLQVNGLGQLNLQNYTSTSSFTGTPVGYLAFDSSGNILTSNPTSAGRNTRITFSAEVPNTWLSMPAAVTFFDNSTGFVTQADLTAYNQVRLIVNKQATAGAASSKIILRYQATSGSPFTASSYSDIGTSEVSVAVNVANNILVTSWINMVSGAKDDVWITILGIDGDGTTSPQFGNIYAEFRYN